MKSMKRNMKIMAVLLSAVMLVSVSALAVNAFDIKQPVEKPEAKAANSDENTIAGDISNITGVDVESILALRNSGKSWNEVLDELKAGNDKKGSGSKERDNILSKSSIGEDVLKKLKKEGFKDNDIQQARLLVERTLFQLGEITGNNSEAAGIAERGSDPINNKDAEKVFYDIAADFDAGTCLYLILKLQKDFGSIDKALDEYIFSLQAGIDLALYIADRDGYLKLREEKAAGIDLKDIVTTSVIEEKMLEKLQQNNKNDLENKDSYDTGAKGTNDISQETDATGVLPDVPDPAHDSVIPQNPADKIKDEINVLDPMKTIDGGFGQ